METVSLTATALGSTIGIIILASLTAWNSNIGRSFRHEYSDTSTFIHQRIEPHLAPTRHRCKEELRSLLRKLILNIIAAWRWWRKGRKTRRKVYAECTWKNFWKALRIVKVWEPLPYDIMYSIPVAERREELVEKPGYIGVCLRFRKGTLEERLHRRDPWELLDRDFSIPKYFPLEKDGSLRLSLVRKAFSVEELEFLVPGRYDPFYASDEDRVSALALVNLANFWKYVNVVEREDYYCQLRRRFRQWLRALPIYCVLRWISYVAIVSSIVALDVCVTITLASQSGDRIEAWVVQIFWGIVAFVFGYRAYISMMRDYYGERRWHILPQRYPRGYLWGIQAAMFL